MSAANALKIWKSEEQTYNESKGTRMDKRPYVQPFTLEDEIVHQILEEADIDYVLKCVLISTEEVLGEKAYDGFEYGTGFYYLISFTLTELGAANNQLVRLDLYADGELVGRTDCISAKTSHPLTLTLSYSNAIDFAGIVYSENRPTFTIRLYGRFFHEVYPTESEVVKASDGSIDEVSGSVFTQRLLELDPIPYYVQKMLKLAMRHNYIATEDGTEWTSSDAYEVEKSNDKNPLTKANILLTKKADEFLTNVYGVVS